MAWRSTSTSSRSRTNSCEVLSKSYESIPWLIILLLAAVLRFAPVGSGLPYIDYVDEGYALHQAIELLNKRSIDPGWYGYPTFPAYLTAGALILEGPIYRLVHGHGFRKDLPREDPAYASQRDNYDLITPPELIVAGRIVAAVLSLGTVVLAGMIATRLGGNAAGSIAALITAVCPALVSRGSNVIVDTFATFFALLALYFCERMRQSPRLTKAALAGFAAGLAFASKYPAGAVFIAIVALIWALPITRSARARFSVVAALGLLTGVALGASATFLKLPTVARDIGATAANYRIINSTPGYFGQAVLNSELGWPLAIAGCLGIGWMFRAKLTRSTALGWILFAGLLLAVFVGKPFQAFRNLLPLVPPLCIAAGIAFSQLIDWARQRPFSSLRLGTIVALICGCIVLNGFFSFRQVQQRMAHRDTRIQAIDWLQQHATNQDKVLGLRELAILPGEWRRLPAAVTVASWPTTLDLLEHERFDYVVTGEFDLRYAPDPNLASAYRDRWQAKVSAMPVQAHFGQIVTQVIPYLWRTSDERILILKTNQP
jgi:hypothetical protein